MTRSYCRSYIAMLLCFFPAASVMSVVSVRDLLSAEKSTVPVRTVFPSFLFVSAYLDGQFKKGGDAQIKAGVQKSYKILRTMDDGGAWNQLILREYTSLASLEANVEKSDAVLQQGSEQHFG